MNRRSLIQRFGLTLAAMFVSKPKAIALETQPQLEETQSIEAQSIEKQPRLEETFWTDTLKRSGLHVVLAKEAELVRRFGSKVNYDVYMCSPIFDDLDHCKKLLKNGEKIFWQIQGEISFTQSQVLRAIACFALVNNVALTIGVETGFSTNPHQFSLFCSANTIFDLKKVDQDGWIFCHLLKSRWLSPMFDYFIV